jgi:hypothetical protein
MSGMPIEARFSHDPQGAVDDATREDVGDRLNQAYAAGDLGIDAYRRLLDATFAARHNADLVPVAQALPGRLQASQPAIGGENFGAPGLPTPAAGSLPAVRGNVPRGALIVAGVLVVAVIVLALVLIV